MTREQIEQKLNEMRQQEADLQQQFDIIGEQLTMTRGAVQMLEHLLTLDDDGATEVAPQLVPSENHKPKAKEG